MFSLFCLFAKAQAELRTYQTWAYVFDGKANTWTALDTTSAYKSIVFIDDSVWVDGNKFVVDHDTITADSSFFMFCYDTRAVKCTLGLYKENDVVQFCIIYNEFIQVYAIIRNDRAVKLK